MIPTLTPLRVREGNGFARTIRHTTGGPLTASAVRTVQVNIGLRCNLACHHCHVESGPKRTEEMSWDTMQHVLRAAKSAGAKTVDITGGAPEMNPNFRRFAAAARRQGHDVIVRTNLTILLKDGYTDLPQWYADHSIKLVASLPCHLENNVDKQRGRGVYHDSIEVIQKLNAVGYGIEEHLPLDLVFNPGGPSLPPRQQSLEGDYKKELGEKYGIRFSKLITITNMPIGRFLHDLTRAGRDEEYMNVLKNAYNPDTVEGLMCRHHLHVSYDGRLYDCDFNYALGLPVSKKTCGRIEDFDPDRFITRKIVTGVHCFACTAGRGSSCGGAVV